MKTYPTSMENILLIEEATSLQTLRPEVFVQVQDEKAAYPYAVNSEGVIFQIHSMTPDEFRNEIDEIGSRIIDAYASTSGFIYNYAEEGSII